MVVAPTQESLGNPAAAYAPVFTPAAPANPASQQLAVNPQLVTHPLGKYTDSTYEAQEAELRATTLRNYNDLLSQLGYVDPDTGQFIRGSIETEAQAEEMRQAFGMELARQAVTDAMQKSGTMFSGYRATQQARQESPYLDAIAQLKLSVPQALSKAYRDSVQSLEDYNLGRDQLLLDAAGRRTTDIEANPPAGDAPSSDTTSTPESTTSTPTITTPNTPYPAASGTPMIPGQAQDPTHGNPYAPPAPVVSPTNPRR